MQLSTKNKYITFSDVRISFQHVNGFLTEDNVEYKLNQIRQYMQEKKFDAHLMVEMNVKWSRGPHKLSINEFSRSWFEN